MKTLKKIWWSMLALVVIAVVAGVWVISNIDQEKWLQTVSAQLKEKTGYALTVKGEVDIKLWPSVHVALGDATVVAPNAAEPFFMTKTMVVGVELMPLLNKQVKVQELELQSPVIYLERMHAKAKTPKAANDNAANVEAGKQAGAAMFSLPKVALRNATIIWDEAAADGHVSALDVDAALPSLDEPATLNITANWRDKPVALDVVIQQPQSLMKKKTSDITVQAELPYDSAVNYAGSLNVQDAPKLKGSYETRTDDMRALMAWLDVAMPGDLPESALREVSLKTMLDYGADAVTLSDATIEVDGQSAAAAIALRFVKGQAMPQFNVVLNAKTLDVRPFMKGQKVTPEVKEDKVSWIASAHAAEGSAEIPVDMLKGLRGKAVWNVGELTLPQMVLSDVKGNVYAKAEQLSLTVEPMKIVGGMLDLSVTMLHKPVPLWHGMINGKNVDMKALLEMFQDEASIEGVGNVKGTFSTRGADVAAMQSNLSGPVSLHVSDGVVKGMDLLEGVKELAVKVKPSRAHAWKSTEFADLKAEAAIAGGVANFTTISMDGPFLAVEGGGTANLATTQLNLSLQPYLVEQKTQDDGTVVADKKRAVPLRVTGGWANAKVTPDVKAEVQRALQDPEKVEKRIKNIRDKIKDGSVGELFDKIF